MAAKKKLDKNTIKEVLRYIKRYRLLLVLSLVSAFVSAVLSLYIPILVGRAIDCAVGAGQVDMDSIVAYLVKIAVCTAVISLSQWTMTTFHNRITFQVIRDIRHEAFEKISTLPLSFIDSHSHGEIVSRVIADADAFGDGLLMGFSNLFTGVVTILGTLIFMLTIHPLITLVVVILTPLSLFVASFIARHTHDMFKKQSETRGEQTAFINEVIAGQKVVSAFGREEAMIEEFSEINSRLEKYALRATFFSSITNPSTRFVNNMVYAAVCLTGALTVLAGGMTVGGLTSFLSYANQYTKPFNEISGVITELQNALACAARVFDLIHQPGEPADPENAVVLSGIRGDVTIDDVSFSYVPEKPLIRHFNLHVDPGKRVAIVGPTGCGKTTLINLLMRFYDVNSGDIAMDGQSVYAATRHSLRENIGMVLQDTWLLDGTVRENIAMGRDVTDEEIIAAAKAAHAHSFIKRLPEGYNTVIGEDKGGLSQGQRQLISIARVMLKVPPMLILDEATSSIDTRTEMKIQEAFAHMMEGRTSFIVAHRLSTIREADMILVMRDGSVVETGTHDELVEKGGFYASLWNSQFSVS
ncbi:MAG: ABC transporter ATP-binding protein [Ruminococcaceae bacterium]|nr:ABC transporter ATP-binding protein [Oscillospiraceae bacterium]